MDVTGTFNPAWQRTQRVLMRRFNLETWLSFGVIFFLQSLLEGSGGYSFRLPSSGKSSGPAVGNLKEIIDGARSWLSANTTIVIPIGVAIGISGTILMLVLLWLGTRGQMMAIRSVMTGRAAIGEHWRETRVAAWSLFKVQVVISLIAFAFWGPLLGFAVRRFVDLVDAGVTDLGSLARGFIPFAVVGGAIGFVLLVVQALIRNFVAPIMLRFGCPARAAWTRFRIAANGSTGSIMLFFVIRAALALGVGVAAGIFMICTCCIGALPVLQQTIMAPWLFFERAYGLYVIESLGPEMTMLEVIPDYAAPLPHQP